jgi:glutamyl-Q tRNA(Asp) synthetase
MNEPAANATSRYRGRFAPSPTGPLHFGSLVAAVGSYLEARTHCGVWLVRIDDLDPPRTVPDAADDILRTLEACGMHWDGEVTYQSARDAAYHAALHELKQRRLVYPCACSRREIGDSAVRGIEGHVYPGTCRAELPEGKTACALRLDTRGATIDFDDALQGRIRRNLETEIGDFIVYRADHVFAYQLAVVVDDAEQGITDVVRGADLLDSTPRQIYLQQLLGYATPRYIHLPVAINTLGGKLSKQTRALAVDTRRPVPQLAAALRFLGHEPPHELSGDRPHSLLQWAQENWKAARVPRARTRPVPVIRDW